jgi:hypothetical protein
MSVDEGYVLGIEPATGFPNRRSFEESKGRLVTLAGGQSKTFRTQLEPIASSYRLNEVIEGIRSLQKSDAIVSPTCLPEWSA